MAWGGGVEGSRDEEAREAVEVECEICLGSKLVAQDGEDGAELWLGGFRTEREESQVWILRELVGVIGVVSTTVTTLVGLSRDDPPQPLQIRRMPPRFLLQHTADLVRDHTDRDAVLHAPRHDQIGDLALRFDVDRETRLHVGEPLLDRAFDGAAAIADVAHDFACDCVRTWLGLNKGGKVDGGEARGHTSSGETEVGIGLDEDLQVGEIEDTWVMEGKDPF